MEMLILLVLMIAMFWFMTRSAKKQRETMVEKQKAAAVPGTWVVTIGGFLGKVVAVDGDVVTLESPSGVETIWTMQALREAYEPNFGAVSEGDEDLAVTTDAPYDTRSAEGEVVAENETTVRENGARPPLRRENDAPENGGDLPRR